MKRLLVGLLILILIVLAASNLKIYRVQTGSMSDTIQPGDYVMVLKKSILANSKSGDIIAFSKTEGKKENVVFIKRIVAQFGDTISSSKTGLTINSKLYPHDSLYDLLRGSTDTLNNNYLYLNYLTKGQPIPVAADSISNNFRILVPKNSYFMVGDNYYGSMDSRFWGFIEEDQIIGKVIAIL